MRGFLIFCGILFFGGETVNGQHLSTWLKATHATQAETQLAVAQVDQFVASLPEPGVSAHRHLAKVFRKVQSSFLKKYEACTDLNALFTEGKYDCLTATALLSQVLTRLGYTFRIVETNYHIFILVDSDEGTVLLESTDRVNGFVADPADVAKRTEGYRLANKTASRLSGGRYQYQYHCNLYQTVSSGQLTGLLLFNRAVKAYNTGEWLASARLLEEAFSLYATDRCLELSDILVRTLVTRKEVTWELRRACMEHLMPMLLRTSGQVAVSGID